jgi:predicted DNA-binding transcriptional regulator AlpA
MAREEVADLARLAREAPPESLPALLGHLEEAKAEGWARLIAIAQGAPPEAKDPDENISAAEAARRLGVSRDWLYKARNLPFRVRVGRRVVFSAKGLARWMRQRTDPRREGTRDEG